MPRANMLIYLSAECKRSDVKYDERNEIVKENCH